jgi:exodeoxyribonuclease X
MRQLFTVIDTETTGLDHATDRVVELGWTKLQGGEIFGPCNMLVNPGRPISLQAMAVHHITDAEVANARPLAEVAQMITEDADAIYVAHNNRFDIPFLAPVIGDRRWIDTYRCALHLWPDFPAHTNQVLRYCLIAEGLITDLQPELAEPAHRAGPDTYVTAHILRAMLKLASVEQLTQWSNELPLLPICYLKKHKGTPWKNVPADYLRWVAGQPDMDADIKHTANYWLNNR